MTMTNLHALNGRDNSVLPWLWRNADGDPERFRADIQVSINHLTSLLSSRKVDYTSLKSTLIPPDGRRQVVFFYDWWEDDSWNYAVEFSKYWLPAIRATLRTSEKDGDLLDLARPDDLLNQQIVRVDDVDIRWSTQFAVYFNNLNDADVATLHNSMMGTPRYRGYVDVTFSGPIRNYLAGMLTFGKIFHDGRVILSHGADEPFVSDEDPVGYPYTEYGLEVVSLLDSYFYAFLDYKIESDSASEFRTDVSLSLAAVTGEIIDLEDVEIFVHTNKLDKYLLVDVDKLRLMTSIGMATVTPEELANTILERLLENYVYDLKIAGDGLTPTFAVSAEFEKPDGAIARRLLALKYDSAQQHIALVSMY